ncbi:hypothetical protein D3C80_1929040 [compost metagenome]
MGRCIRASRSSVVHLTFQLFVVFGTNYFPAFRQLLWDFHNFLDNLFDFDWNFDNAFNNTLDWHFDNFLDLYDLFNNGWFFWRLFSGLQFFVANKDSVRSNS